MEGDLSCKVISHIHAPEFTWCETVNRRGHCFLSITSPLPTNYTDYSASTILKGTDEHTDPPILGV